MTNQYHYVPVERAYKELKNFAPIHLIDVRSQGEFAYGHAKGAKSLPLDELDVNSLQHRIGAHNLGRQTVYLLCQSGVRAEMAANKLQQMGLRNLAVVKGGIDAWRNSNLPIVRTSSLLSLERQTQIALGGLLLLILFKGWVLHPAFYVLIALLGIGLIAAGVTARCGLTALLARMPWNQQHGNSTA